MSEHPVENTDREIYREPKGDLPSVYYAPHVFVTAEGNVGMSAGGNGRVKSISDWVSDAAALAEMERYRSESYPSLIDKVGQLAEERNEARRDRDRFAQTIEFRVKELDEARTDLDEARHVIEALVKALAEKDDTIEQLQAGREIERTMLANVLPTLAAKDAMIERLTEAEADALERVHIGHAERDEARAEIRRVRVIVDALTEDNAYDNAALESANVSVSEAQTYPAIISERTSVIDRLRAALDTEVAP